MDWLQATRVSLERQERRKAARLGAFTKMFTERACDAIRIAEEEAHASRLLYIGAEHFLLGLLRVGTGVGFVALNNVGLTYEAVSSEVVAQIGKTEAAIDVVDISFTPRAIRIVQTAKNEAKAQKHVQADTEHLLLGILAESDGLPVTIFNKFGIDTKRMQDALIANR